MTPAHHEVDNLVTERSLYLYSNLGGVGLRLDIDELDGVRGWGGTETEECNSVYDGKAISCERQSPPRPVNNVAA